MDKGKLMRSVLAMVLAVACLLSAVPAAFATEEREQVVVDASELLELQEGTQTEEGEETEDITAQTFDALCEEYGLAPEEKEDPEFGYLTNEQRRELGIEERPETKDAISPDYVFLDFKVGSNSRKFNWQIHSDYVNESNELDFGASMQGTLVGKFQGIDGYVYMPMETSTYKTIPLNGYKIKSGDIVQIYINSVSATSLFKKDGTAKGKGSIFMNCSANEGGWTQFGSDADITYTTGAQTVTFTASSANVGKTLYSIRWDPTNANLSDVTTITFDYIYIGPKETAPVNVQYVKDDNTMMTHGGGWSGWGKKAPAWSTGKTPTDNNDGTQTIWGWAIYHRNSSGSWANASKFVTDPSTVTCTEHTRFKLTEVTIRKQTLKSTQKYDNGASTEDDKYTFTVDGFDTAEMTAGSFGTPLDIAILMDRSGSQAEISEVKDLASKSAVTTYSNTLNKNVAPGYYRATCFRKNKSDGVSSGFKAYTFTMPMRYYRGQWQMQIINSSCRCNGSSHDSYGIYFFNNTGMIPCSHVQWVSLEDGYQAFVNNAATTGWTSGPGISSRDGDVLYFKIGISRLGRVQAAVEDFLAALYNSNTALKPGDVHKVSLIGYGRSVFMSGYPYHNSNYYTVSNNYGSCTTTAKEVNYSTYQSILKTIRDPYVQGATRTDAALQVLSGTLSDMEKGYGKTSVTASSTSYLAAPTTGRKRVVILVTDGVPSSDMYFDETVANKAVAASAVLKADGSTTVYAIGIMDGLDDTKYANEDPANADSETKKANKFLNAVSSRYKTTTVYNPTSGKTAGNYYLASDGAGVALAEQVGKIWQGTAPSLEASTLTGPGSLWLYEDFGREWKPDPSANVKIYAEAYSGSGKFSGTKVLIGQHKVSDNTKSQTFTGNGYTLYYTYDSSDQSFSYALKWTDAKTAFLRETALNAGSQAKAVSGSLNTTKGYKVYMEMPIEVDRNNTLGGNNINLTTELSGCYQARNADDEEMGTRLYSYEQPNANVFCSVGAEAHDYFVSMEEYVAIVNNKDEATLKSVMDQMMRMPENLVVTNAKGLSNCDYVKFNVQVQSPSGTTMYHKGVANYGDKKLSANIYNFNAALADLKSDQKFTMTVSMTHRNKQTDSFGRSAYPAVNTVLYPTYYVPKFAVVDFGDDIAVPMELEADKTRLDNISNGSYDATAKTMKFNFGDGIIKDSIFTIPYTYKTVNTPMGATSNVVQREVTIIPGNLITYDDDIVDYKEAVAGTPKITKFTVKHTDPNTGAVTEVEKERTQVTNLVGWEEVGKKVTIQQTFDNSLPHGYDPAYATTGDFHGSSMMATVGEYKTYDADGDLIKVVSEPKAEGSFSFKGTGFEIVSRTSQDSGVLLAEVFRGTTVSKDTLEKSILVNTYLATNDYYQAPVIRWSGVYGEYTVILTAYYHVAFASRGTKNALTEGEVRDILGYDASVDFTYIPSESAGSERALTDHYNVYVDAIRVFNTAQLNTVSSYAYDFAGEEIANFADIQDIVLDSKSWKGGDANGMLYMADQSKSSGYGETEDVLATGIPLVMDGIMKFDDVDFVNPKGEIEARSYFLNRSGKRIQHPTYKKDLFRMIVDGAYRYYIDNPDAEADSHILKLDRDEVRVIIAQNGGYFITSSYKSFGAKNEVQLAKGSGVAFTYSGTNVFISLKSLNGTACDVEYWNGSKFVDVPFTLDNGSKPLASLTSTTEMFYNFKDYTYNGMVIIRNNGSGVLCVSHAKTQGGSRGIYVDDRTAYEAAKAFETPLDQPIETDSLKMAHSLNLRSDISINYVVSAATLAEYDRYELVCEVNGKTYYPVAEDRGQYIYFTLDCLNASMMNDNVRAQLTAYKGDEVHTSPVDDYSIATYAFTMMNREDATEQFKRVCANLLRYGAATQTYLGYNTDALADEEMTEEQRAYLCDLDTVTFGSNYTVGNDVADATVVWQGRTLSLTSTVTVKLVVNVSEYEGNAEDLELRVSYVAANGEEKTFTVAPQVYNADKGQYLFDVDRLNAADLRAVLTCQVFAGDVAVSQTLTYSADTYGNGKTGTLLDLCKALFAYVDEAKAFFG